MTEQFVRVECYSGYKAEGGRYALCLRRRASRLRKWEDRWYSPGATYFRVLAESGDRYVLRRDDAQDAWSLTAYRAAGKRVDTKINQSV